MRIDHDNKHQKESKQCVDSYYNTCSQILSIKIYFLNFFIQHTLQKIKNIKIKKKFQINNNGPRQ